MKADPLARVLSDLISKQYVTRSELGSRTRLAIGPLFDMGALKEARHGAGWRIVVTNLDALKNFVDARFPLGLESAVSGLGRTEAVSVLRDSKRGVNSTGEPVLIRGFSGAHLVSPEGKIDVRSATDLCGTACIVLTDNLVWNYEGGRVALVENLDPFLRFDEQYSDFDAAIYCAGRISERLLNWLESQTFDIVHFGDYDPVGLQEYLRIKKRTGHRVTLFIPDNLQELVRRFGKSKLLRDSTPILSSLRQEEDEVVRDVLQLLENAGMGLEQEILWADWDSPEIVDISAIID